MRRTCWTINLVQGLVNNGFFTIGWRWPTSGSKVGFGVDFVKKRKKKPSKPTSDPLLSHFQPMTKRHFFDPLLCLISCSTILALREIRPIITLVSQAFSFIPHTSGGHPMFALWPHALRPSSPQATLSTHWEKLNRGVSKPGCFPLTFRERSRLCRGPFRDCSSCRCS